MTERTSRLLYEPSLDGVRALAVVAVLCFHGGFGWASGGFLGVSLFFTLSGFLITSLLLAEHDATGGIRLTTFWARRLRRLLPASFACLAGVAVLASSGLLPRTSTLRGDFIAAVLNVANWRFHFSGQSYGQLFAAPSPLQHFWSLAIEEQFYLVFPPLVWLLVVKARLGRRGLAIVLGAAWVAASAASVVLGRRDPDLVYQATFTRAAELLAGALGAIAVSALVARRRGAPAVPARPRALLDAGAAIGGAAAMGVVISACVTVHQSDTWLYRGGLSAFGIASLALVLTARLPIPMRTVLRMRPFAWVGRVSYGVYLYHWPIFLVLSPQRTGLSTAPLFAVRVGTTLAVAAVSFYALEQPVRQGRALRGVPARLAAPAGATALLCAAWTVVPMTAAPGWAVAAARPDVSVVDTRAPGPPSSVAPRPSPTMVPAASLAAAPADAQAGPAPSAPPSPAGPVRVLVAGDSTANALAPGLAAWAADTDATSVDPSGVKIGCGYVTDGRDKVGPAPRDLAGPCGTVLDHVRRAAAASAADVALVIDGPWEVTDHQAPRDVWRSPGDPAFDARVATALGNATDALLEHVRVVVWATSPVIHPGWGFAQADDAWEPERMTVLNGLIRQVAAERPGRVIVVDYAAWMDGSPNGMDAQMRPDGVHLSPDGARTVADWLGPQLRAAVAAASADR